MDNGLPSKVLACLCKIHKQESGDRINQKVEFDVFSFCDPRLGALITDDPDFDGDPAGLMMTVFSELTIKNYLFDLGEGKYILTELGYSKGTQTLIRKFLDVLDSNQGLSAFVAALAASITVISQYASIV